MLHLVERLGEGGEDAAFGRQVVVDGQRRQVGWVGGGNGLQAGLEDGAPGGVGTVEGGDDGAGNWVGGHGEFARRKEAGL